MRKGDDDVLALCSDAGGNSEAQPLRAADFGEEFGFVYLIRSGRYFKIGRTNAVGRRERELAIQLPERAVTVHSIRTDDPQGIEAYWHQRFAARRKNGEWVRADNRGPKGDSNAESSCNGALPRAASLLGRPAPSPGPNASDVDLGAELDHPVRRQPKKFGRPRRQTGQNDVEVLAPARHAAPRGRFDVGAPDKKRDFFRIGIEPRQSRPAQLARQVRGFGAAETAPRSARSRGRGRAP